MNELDVIRDYIVENGPECTCWSGRNITGNPMMYHMIFYRYARLDIEIQNGIVHFRLTEQDDPMGPMGVSATVTQVNLGDPEFFEKLDGIIGGYRGRV